MRSSINDHKIRIFSIILDFSHILLLTPPQIPNKLALKGNLNLIIKLVLRNYKHHFVDICNIGTFSDAKIIIIQASFYNLTSRSYNKYLEIDLGELSIKLS
uniref:Uncharacterized protein n=1 Tax=Rhizophagus irregularis (strain DAOM 181602 / DAOM 197198 / MUCL 43194) TaxID=747089 RepID=U9SQH9_RHIID